MAKRKDYIKWDEYFMGLAVFASLRSKDPNTQVGCCIVDADNRILSLGYNGFPIGCSDDEFPWDREGKNSYDTKYNYVCHAELNAILNYANDDNLFIPIIDKSSKKEINKNKVLTKSYSEKSY